MVSLILALALAEALRGLSEIATSHNRYLPHTLWLVFYVSLITQNWWGYWDFVIIDEWRFTTYLLALTLPAVTFANIYLLVPATRVMDTDWREQFLKAKQWFFGLGSVYVVVAIFAGAEYFDIRLSHPYRLFQGSFALISVIGIFSRSETVHKLLPVLALILFIASQFLERMNIGAFVAD